MFTFIFHGNGTMFLNWLQIKKKIEVVYVDFQKWIRNLCLRVQFAHLISEIVCYYENCHLTDGHHVVHNTNVKLRYQWKTSLQSDRKKDLTTFKFTIFSYLIQEQVFLEGISKQHFRHQVIFFRFLKLATKWGVAISFNKEMLFHRSPLQSLSLNFASAVI